jgi:predicted alpha/beta-fold hydrolase
MNDCSAYKAAKEITIPILVIHDKDDLEVPVKQRSIFTII